MKINFNYIQETPDNLRQETKGCVALKGEKYKLDLMGSTRIFDGQKLYDIIPEDEEINIAHYNPNDDQELTPSKMLSFYEKGYDYERSEEHTSELQSRGHLVCRLLLEKKNKKCQT